MENKDSEKWRKVAEEWFNNRYAHLMPDPFGVMEGLRVCFVRGFEIGMLTQQEWDKSKTK